MTGGNLHEQTAQAIGKEWDLALPDTLDEAAVLQKLADRIVLVLERGPDTFFQLMYRLDISEKKLTAILNDDNVAAKIARLVYDRQLQKIRSKHASPKEGYIDDEELRW